jgi:hypothetical protein
MGENALKVRGVQKNNYCSNVDFIRYNGENALKVRGVKKIITVRTLIL